MYFTADDCNNLMRMRIMQAFQKDGIKASKNILKAVGITATVETDVQQYQLMAAHVANIIKNAVPLSDIKGRLNPDSDFMNHFWDDLYTDPMYADANLPKECIADLASQVIIYFDLNNKTLDDDMKAKFLDVFACTVIKYLDGLYDHPAAKKDDQKVENPDPVVPAKVVNISSTINRHVEIDLSEVTHDTIQFIADKIVPPDARIDKLYVDHPNNNGGNKKLVIEYTQREQHGYTDTK
jgi:hypothetical protein